MSFYALLRIIRQKIYSDLLVLALPLAGDSLGVSLLLEAVAFGSFGFSMAAGGLVDTALMDSLAGCSFGFGFFFGRPPPLPPS